MEVQRQMDQEGNNKRKNSFLIIISLIFAILIFRLFYIQIIKGEEYKQKAIRNSLRQNIIRSTRGKIYDVNGNIFADNSTGYKIVHLQTKTISSKEKDILLQMYKDNKAEYNKLKKKSREKLDEIFFDVQYIAKISENKFEDILDVFYKTPPTGFDKEIVAVEDIDKEIALKEVEKLPNDRIDIVEYNKRHYPNKKLLSHALGYVKLIDADEYEKLKEKSYLIDDLIGKKGIEKQYDIELKGINGKEFVEVDVKGNIKKKLDEEAAVSGKSIYLSIDKELQEYMTEQFRDLAGSFIAIDIKTGKIITFVSSPEIDSNLLSSKINQETWNKFINSKATPLVNKGIAGLYPPASIFKIVTGAALLESGIDPYKTVYSTGTYTYGKVSFRDARRQGHGSTNFFKSIEESVNTYYYDLITKIDKNKFFEIAREFGIGEKTGIDIDGENEGLLPTPEWKKNKFKDKRSKVWLPGDMINMSIGQGYLLVTPIQMLMVYQAIANNGVLLYPTLIDKMIDANGNVSLMHTKIKRKINISDKTIKILQKALELPVKGAGGTAKVLRIPNVDVSAKTGTAQNSASKNHSWIAGYFPSKNPKIAFISLVEQGGYGGVISGQKARLFIEKYYMKGVEDESGKK